MELLKTIEMLKQNTDTVILAHTYQPPEIIDIADVTGDSFKLSECAAGLPQKRVIMCGVGFMAETVKILSPQKQVILAAPQAACPMATQIDPMRVQQFKQQNPHVGICCYINTTAALKAQCDVCVTSSSAVSIVKAMEEKTILFIPDQNLGAYVAQQVPEKEIITWDGFCPVHNQVTESQILALKQAYPNVPVAIHPECKPQVVAHCEMVGSTAEIITFAKACQGDVIIATEKGVAEYLNLHEPTNKQYIQACGETLVCPDMKMTSLADVVGALQGTAGREIVLDETVRIAAKSAIDRMLKLGK